VLRILLLALPNLQPFARCSFSQAEGVRLPTNAGTVFTCSERLLPADFVEKLAARSKDSNSVERFPWKEPFWERCFFRHDPAERGSDFSQRFSGAWVFQQNQPIASNAAPRPKV